LGRPDILDRWSSSENLPENLGNRWARMGSDPKSELKSFSVNNREDGI
jgi:hypothetical protein